MAPRGTLSCSFGSLFLWSWLLSLFFQVSLFLFCLLHPGPLKLSNLCHQKSQLRQVYTCCLARDICQVAPNTGFSSGLTPRLGRVSAGQDTTAQVFNFVPPEAQDSDSPRPTHDPTVLGKLGLIVASFTTSE